MPSRLSAAPRVSHVLRALRGAARPAAIGSALAIIVVSASTLLADPDSPLSITKTDSPDPVASGSQLTYTITVVNTGGARINNVVLSDQVNGIGGIGVPPQLVLTSTRGSCQQSNALVTCNAGNIEGNGAWTVTIRGVVTAANGTTINNTASVTGTRSAQNFTSTATTSTLVSNGGGAPQPDLTISKTGPTSVTVNAPMTYTLTVNNSGTANATDVTVVDTVPAGVTIASAAGTSLFACNVAGQTVTCSGGAVNQGSNATITITGSAPAAPTTLTNTASVDPDDTIDETNELNNTSALVNTLVTSGSAAPDLSIDKTDTNGPSSWDDGAGPDPVNPGQLITYKILVTNTSAFRADDVVIVDGTQGLEAASIQVSQIVTNGTVGTFGGCTVSAPQTRCSIRSLNAGGTLLMTVTGQVVAAAGSNIVNTATVTGNIKNKGVTTTDTELTTVKPSIDLTVTKADNPDPVCASSWPVTAAHPAPASPPLLAPPVCLGGLTYTFVVGNSGIIPATGVVLRDPLPPGTTFDHFVDVNGGGFTCGVAANVVTCTGGTIPPESTKTVRIVLVAPPNTGAVSNTITVDPNNAIFEADETNNTATQATQVVTGVDLTILKVDSAPGFDPIATNGTQTYTITVDNIGTQDAASIRVRDTLPATTIFRSAQGSNGFTCSHAGGVVECVGGALRGTDSEFYDGLGEDHATIVIKVFAQPIVGTMHNEVRVDPLNEIAEANESNNVDFEDTVVGSGGAGQGAFNQFTIDKTLVSPLPANNIARNAIVTFNIAVHNDGTDPAVGVAVRDFMPAGSRYIEATATNEFLCASASGVVECVGGQIPAGGTATITLKLFAPDTPGPYTNQSIVDPDNAIPEGNEFDNQDSLAIEVKNGGNGAFNDLTIDKTDAGDVKPKAQIVYTLTVSNSGSNAALNVAVRDVTPIGTTFVSAQDSVPGTPGAFTCSETAGVVDCTGATIPGGGGSRQITIIVTAPNQNTVLTNQAFVDPDNAIPEGDESNNTDTETTSVSSVINLKIEKQGPTSSSQSQVTPYTVTVTNQPKGAGADQRETAFNVQMHDPLPVGLIPLAVDTGTGNNWQCQVAENPINVVDCEGDLAPDQSVTITITVFMTAESGRSLDNEACVDPANLIEEFNPPGETDNCSTHTSLGGEKPKLAPDLLVSKNVDKTLVTEGDSLQYTITVANAGQLKAKTPLTVKDTLPASVTIVGTPVTTNGWTCTVVPNGGTVDITCSDPGSGLDPGAFATITVNATVNAGTASPIANTATADPAQFDDCPDPGAFDCVNETETSNNSASIVSNVSGAPFDLSIASITDNPDPAVPGQALKYSVVAVNGGTQDANNVHIKIDLPSPGATFVGADGSNGFNCAAPVLNAIDCVGDLPAGGNTVILVSLTVVLAPPGDLTLVATIDPTNVFTNETDEGNNTDSEVTTVSGTACVGCVDLIAAQLVASPDPAAAGGSTVFTYVLINVGDMPTSLTNTQPLTFFDVAGTGPATFSAVTSSNPAITCTVSASGANFVLNDCVGNLGPGQGVVLTITASGLTAGSITAAGTADPALILPEFKENNNSIANSVVVQ